MAPVPFEDLNKNTPEEASISVRERVVTARKVQKERFSMSEDARHIHANAQMSSRLVRRHCELDDAGQQLIKTALVRLGLSARAYDRILKVANHRRSGRCGDCQV